MPVNPFGDTEIEEDFETETSPGVPSAETNPFGDTEVRAPQEETILGTPKVTPQFGPGGKFEDVFQLSPEERNLPPIEERSEALRQIPGGIREGGALAPGEVAPPPPFTPEEREELNQREMLAIQQQLGDTKFDLTTSDVSAATVAKMAFAENPSDKRTIFKRDHPTFTLFNLDTRFNREAAYFDPETKEVHLVNPRGADLADVAQGSPLILDLPVVLPVAAGAVSAGKGLSLARAAALQVAASGTAPFAKQGILEFSDLEGMTSDELWSEATTDALLAVGVELGTSTFGRLANSLRGAGGLEVDSVPKIIQEFAKKEGLEPLSIDEMSMVAAGVMKQVAQFGPDIPKAKAKKAQVFKDKLDTWISEVSEDSGFQNQFDIDKAHENVVLAITEQLLDPGVSIQELAKSIPKGLKGYVTKSQETFRTKYSSLIDDARSAGAEWDISPVQGVANKIREGVRLRGATKTVEEEVVEEVSSPGMLGVGTKEKITKLTAKDIKEPDIRIAPNTVEIDTMLTRILDADSVQEDPQALLNLRTLFFQAQKPKGLTRTPSESAAKEMYDALTDVISKPKNATEDWTELWKQTSGEYALFKQHTQWIDDRKLVDSFDIEKRIPETVFEGLNHERLSFLKVMLPEKEYKTLQDGFKSHLLEGTAPISQKLAAFKGNDKTLDMLMTPIEQVAFHRLGIEQARASSSAFTAFTKKLSTAPKVVEHMIKTGEVAQLDQIIAANPKLKDVFKAGVLQDIVTGASKTTKAVKAVKLLDDGSASLIDQTQFIAEVTKHEKSGVLEYLFDADEIERITNFRNYASITAFESDTGANLAAQAEFGKLGIVKSFLRPDQSLVAAMHIASRRREGNILNSPALTRVLFGDGTKPFNVTTARELATVTALANDHYEDLMGVEIPTELLDKIPKTETDKLEEDLTGSLGDEDLGGGQGDDFLGEFSPTPEEPPSLEAELSEQGETNATTFDEETQETPQEEISNEAENLPLDKEMTALTEQDTTALEGKPDIPLSAFITRWEDNRSKVYTEDAGHRTVGIGFDMDAKGARERWVESGVSSNFDDVLNGKAELQEGESGKLFEVSSRIALNEMEDLLKEIPIELGENQKTALASLLFNVGKSGLTKIPGGGETKAWKALKAGNIEEFIHNALTKEGKGFVNAGGHFVQGLLNRREAEEALWRKDLTKD